MTAVAKKWTGGGQEGVHFFCPGCNEVHGITYSPTGWSFNGNLVSPTFTPSVLVRGHKVVKDEKGKWTGDWVRDDAGGLVPEICHSFVTDGRIQFLSDCTHPLKGQTVDLPPWKDDEEC